MVPPAALTVLDIGCSNGALGASIRDASPGRYVVGVEVDPTFVVEAKRRLDRVICADLNAIEWSKTFCDQKFDCIIFADVLEHLADPFRHVLEAHRFLHPGGCIIISLPNIRHISALYAIFFQGRFPRRERGIFDKSHLRWFTVADAIGLVEKSGMKVVEKNYSLRFTDKGNGKVDNFLRKHTTLLAKFYFFREFFSYQVCLRSVKR